MDRIIRSLLLAAPLFMALNLPAVAQNYYVDLRGGGSYLFDSDAEGAGAGAEATFEQGYFAALALGLQWIDGWRVEGEMSWRRNDFEELAAVAVTDGQVEAYTASINVAYRFLHDRSASPYLGAGAGASRLAVRDLPSGLATVDGFDVVFAWQAMAGVDFSLSDSVTLSLEYRYFETDEAGLTDSLGAAWPIALSGSTALLGLRVGF